MNSKRQSNYEADRRDFALICGALLLRRETGRTIVEQETSSVIEEIHDLDFSCPDDPDGLHSIGCGCEA